MSVSTTALPGDTASGRSGPSIWRRVLYPRSPFGLVARFSATHKRTETVSGPPQSQTRSLEGSGSQTDPLTPWYNVRAGIIPFRYSPHLLGGKGTSHIGWETGELTSKGEKIRVSHLAPHPAHAFPTAERLVVVVS
jgi:hypothetical protein